MEPGKEPLIFNITYQNLEELLDQIYEFVSNKPNQLEGSNHSIVTEKSLSISSWHSLPTPKDVGDVL